MDEIYTIRPNTPLINVSPRSRSESPQNQTIEDYLRSGDLESIKVLLFTNPTIEISENLIIDCSKGLKDLPYNKMSIYGSIIQGRFRAWRYIVERINRELTENEIEAILVVANSLYKDINWRHPFWTTISIQYNEKLNGYAKKWIQYRTN